MTALHILQLSDVSFHYPEHSLISNLSITIPAGVTIVRGGDGRGKTTLLRLLAGEESAHSGAFSFDGLPCDPQSQAYQQQCYYVDPRTATFDQLLVPDFFALIRARFAGFDDAALPALIDGLGLTPHIDKQLFMLSTGSKRKVYLAGAFAAGAALTLLDDPFASLDKASINFVCERLNALSAPNTFNAGEAARQMWVASFYEVPQAIDAVAVVDLGD